MELQNDLMLKVARGEKTSRPPVWLMRQAGRILPQYRALRAKLSGFKELVKTPELAAEVTIQPVDELGVDAAIMFSDILVIPEAMGLNYELIEKKGPHFPRTIQSSSDIEQLIDGEEAAGQLTYVYDAIKAIKRDLNSRVPLIGFAGAPWTILSYMIEGGGSKTFSKARRFLYTNPKEAHQLLEKITKSTTAYLKLQIANGVNLVQVFDSWAGVLPPDVYEEFGLKYIKKIQSEINEVPLIVFAKDAWFALDSINESKPNVIGLDWHIKPDQFRAKYGDSQVVQGNLDPTLLYADHHIIKEKTNEMIRQFGGHHIVNLGHGVYPDTPLDGVKCFVDTVKSYQYE